MKKGKFVYLMLAALFVLASCADNLVNSPIEDEGNNQEVAKSTKVSLEEALSLADEFMAEIEPSTRRNTRSVSTIEIIGGNGTRGSECPDSLLYLVNYDHNEGFALLGMDRGMAPIYAISSDGHLNIQEAKQNPMFSMFLDAALGHATSTYGSLEPIGGPTYIPVVRTKYAIPAFVWPRVMKWNQNEPFNAYCFTSSGESAYPGCVPVAAAIVLSTLRWPEVYAGQSFNWVDMVENDNRDAAAKMINIIGEKAFGVHYSPYNGSEGSWVNEGNISWGFERMGFTLNKDFWGLSFSDDIKKGYTSKTYKILAGRAAEGMPSQAIMVTGKKANGAGHAFVVDGMVIREKIYLYNGKIVSQGHLADPLFHVIWGWDNVNSERTYNGYFLFDANADCFSKEPLDINGKSIEDGKGKKFEGDANSYGNLVICSGLIPGK